MSIYSRMGRLSIRQTIAATVLPCVPTLTRAKEDMVDGEGLATALTAKDSCGSTRYGPTLVSLATCDSVHHRLGAYAPGGSIAHELHAAWHPLGDRIAISAVDARHRRSPPKFFIAAC